MKIGASARFSAIDWVPIRGVRHLWTHLHLILNLRGQFGCHCRYVRVAVWSQLFDDIHRYDRYNVGCMYCIHVNNLLRGLFFASRQIVRKLPRLKCFVVSFFRIADGCSYWFQSFWRFYLLTTIETCLCQMSSNELSKFLQAHVVRIQHLRSETCNAYMLGKSTCSSTWILKR